jgi:sugar phosphate isomerase/epimerase
VNNVHVHIPYPKIREYLTYITQNRLNLEIFFPSSSLDSLKKEDIRALKESLGYHPSLSIHAPFMDMSPGAVDSRIRDVTVERFFQVMEVAELLAPQVIVFHSGYEKWKYGHRVDIWLEGSLTTWRPLRERAAALNLKIAIENIFEDEPSNLLLLMEELHSEHFGLCFDTGHFNLFTRLPLEAWLKSLKPYIFELHLHDNDKSRDQHLPIGEGTFNFAALFAELQGNHCVYTIEAHTPERVLRSMGRLREYITASPSGS